MTINKSVLLMLCITSAHPNCGINPPPLSHILLLLSTLLLGLTVLQRLTSSGVRSIFSSLVVCHKLATGRSGVTLC